MTDELMASPTTAKSNVDYYSIKTTFCMDIYTTVDNTLLICYMKLCSYLIAPISLRALLTEIS